MRVLLHSNGPNVPTGYGVQTANLARSLKADGHDVAISVYYGHQVGLGDWEGIPLLPCSGEAYGNDVLHDHAMKWFDGDPLGGWIITIMDVFGIVTPVLNQFNVAAWTPMDHSPCPPPITEFFERTNAVPIGMSKWGTEELRAVGLDPLYAPLTIDTEVFKPYDDAKAKCGLAGDRFVVMMNAMNKGAVPNRKGFDIAIPAFAQFARNHPDALLYIHAEAHGPYAQGISLAGLAQDCGIPEDQIKFCDQYAYRCGFIPAEHLALTYAAADVLLAPSKGEGFCLPVIEAQAAGVPVIVTDFAAQPELVGAGWKVPGEWSYDPAQRSAWRTPYLAAVVEALESAYTERGSETNRAAAIAKASDYDQHLTYQRDWKPILAQLEGKPVELDRPKIPKKDAVAVLIPAMKRPENVAPLVASFNATQKGVANLYFVCDEDDDAEIAAVKDSGAHALISTRGSTYAQKVNSGYEQTTEPWIFIAGDDVRFHKGWIDAARKLSDRFDVIGTNDTITGRGNPAVKNKSHADHFFVRRSYCDVYGASLDEPVCSETYRHFYTDVELIELAKARKVFTPCLESVVEHLHPDLFDDITADDVYKAGWAKRQADHDNYRERVTYIEQQRQGLRKVRQQ